LKLFPVLGTCRATEDKIEKFVEELVRERFSGLSDNPLHTYAILYKVRCNNIARETLLSAVGRAVHRASPTSRVDLGNPDYIISIDVLGKFACISILKDFYKLKKYNLQELAKSGSGTLNEAEVELVGEVHRTESKQTSGGSELERNSSTVGDLESVANVVEMVRTELDTEAVSISSTIPVHEVCNPCQNDQI
jgi:tRNA acetyltransferase TAN1